MWFSTLLGPLRFYANRDTQWEKKRKIKRKKLKGIRPKLRDPVSLKIFLGVDQLKGYMLYVICYDLFYIYVIQIRKK